MNVNNLVIKGLRMVKKSRGARESGWVKDTSLELHLKQLSIVIVFSIFCFVVYCYFLFRAAFV